MGHMYAALTASSSSSISLKCAIFAGGFPAKADTAAAVINQSDLMTAASLNEVDVPSLHIFGERDTRVPPSASHDLARCFRGAQLFCHDRGHIVPQRSEDCERIISFLDSCFEGVK